MDGISPFRAFYQSPGEPTVPFETWLRIFKSYVLALADKKRGKEEMCVANLHGGCGGTAHFLHAASDW